MAEKLLQQQPGTKEAPAKEDTQRWIKWAKDNPKQAAVMIKDWIGTEEGG
ncbi:hypothetical protein [Candidatus Magnetominusculus xianensis]|uniref:Uncharacterized protein n=1 Tax=Candidatus Magnetominusculus xianensis TaxID=1748249 RepID=A0ABR5SEY7_9BACT|nr:hypothetical protein [Candidatus Magnetominusculus xianensis]KWT85139.1 hypothetical protein ASN18_1787 [Candidatus Magnetominusculus xianensis]MBF0405397.1 hypothetical protein [Nitrospirota bacterium]